MREGFPPIFKRYPTSQLIHSIVVYDYTYIDTYIEYLGIFDVANPISACLSVSECYLDHLDVIVVRVRNNQGLSRLVKVRVRHSSVDVTAIDSFLLVYLDIGGPRTLRLGGSTQKNMPSPKT